MFFPCRENWDFFDKSPESYEGNTGFYFARSNPKVLKMWQEYFEQDKKDKKSLIDDQTLFWTALRSTNNLNIKPLKNCSHQPTVPTDVLIACHLHPCLTGVGIGRNAVYNGIIEYAKMRNSSLLSAHANFIVSNAEKEKALKRRGMWISRGIHDSNACDTYIHP